MRSLKAALGALLCGCVLGVPALAQNGAVKIGVLDDMSGPYAENTGPGDVAAAKFAIADFGGKVLGKPIELVSADFQSKVDVGVGIAKRWYDDENVDLVIGIPNSAIALALVKVAAEKNRIVMPTAAATSELTGKSCSYLMQAKTPEESKGEWDLAKIIATVPGKEAFRPLNEGGALWWRTSSVQQSPPFDGMHRCG
jgi:branched-chain amino acid transport system substrate-binding protein